MGIELPVLTRRASTQDTTLGVGTLQATLETNARRSVGVHPENLTSMPKNMLFLNVVLNVFPFKCG